MQRVVIIGSGNLAEALSRAVSACSSLELIQLFARNTQRGPLLARLARTTWVSEPEKLATAEIYLICVSDRAVAEVAAGLPIPPEAFVVHTAGSVGIEVLPAKFARRGVLYPLQTFTRGREVDFSKIPLFVEAASEEPCCELEAFARKLSPTVLRADSALRARIHLAAVFACNFANHMYALGGQILQQTGVGFEVLRPLIDETAAKACNADSPAAVQTGPAVRNDLPTMARHEALLSADPLLENIYQTISQSIWETSKKI